MQDYLKIDAVNASTLKPFVRSVNYGIWANAQEKESESMTLGTLVHSLVLEGKDAFEELLEQKYLVGGPINEKTGKTYGKETKAFTDWCLINSNGREVISQEDYDKITSMAKAVANHRPTEQLLVRCPEREKTIVWEIDGVKCKARLDFLGNRIAGDLKTIAKLDSKWSIIRAIRQYGYDLQFAWYFDGARECGLDVREFFASFVGSSEDMDVATFRISKEMLDNGRILYQEALKRYIDAKNGICRGQFPVVEDISSIVNGGAE